MNYSNQSIQLFIELLSVRSAGYREIDIYEVDHCFWMQLLGRGEEEIAILANRQVKCGSVMLF